ncbi:hypothetical protein D3C71_1103520 [compost metagenome]
MSSTKPAMASTGTRMPRTPPGPCADHSQRAARASTASCASSIGLSSGSHGSGAAEAGSASRHTQPRPSTANRVAVSAVRRRSKRGPSGSASHGQRSNAIALTSSHGSNASASDQPCASAKRSASQMQASDTTVGHSSHQVNCAASALRSWPPRRHHRLRTPSAANTAQASAP